MTFERILSHFQVRKRGTGKAQCICPAHADREASLTLTDGNDRALIKCHAGCSTEEVVIAAGLKMSDLFYGDGLAKERWRAYIENREKRKIEAVYNYASINGDYAYTKVRLEGKKMLFGILSNERFAYGLNGKNKKTFNAVYGSISSIKRAIERKEPVFIPEGEKDVNTLVKKGYTAFSCGGANDWNKNVSELCKDADVIVLADNDDPGKKLASNIVYNALKEVGVPLDELNKKLAQEFPSAAQATKSSVDSSIVEAQKTVSSSTGKMKTDAETNLAGVKKAAEDASGGVNTTTVTNWGNSASEVKKNLDKMKQTANLKLGEMQKTVESHFSGQYNTMTKKWEKACERIAQLITQMVRSTEDRLNGLARNMNTIGNEMSNNLINGISGAVTGIAGILNEVVSKVNSTISNVNSSLSGIEKAFTFSYDVTTPDGKRRWGKYSMNLPRVSTVPYLAKGAVIPPRSEFLAVLGDQKQGNNIETPEALLRKIVREETAGRQAGGGSYRFTAQINRRTLFDEMMKEAQMRRDTSGRNPFEMA